MRASSKRLWAGSAESSVKLTDPNTTRVCSVVVEQVKAGVDDSGMFQL